MRRRQQHLWLERIRFLYRLVHQLRFRHAEPEQELQHRRSRLVSLLRQRHQHREFGSRQHHLWLERMVRLWQLLHLMWRWNPNQDEELQRQQPLLRQRK